MNEMKRTLLALATTLSLTTAALLGSSPAFASDYSGNCAGISSFDGTGNVDITDTSCSLPQSITASGFIHISADSVSGSGLNLTAGDDVSVTASGGAITIGNVTSGSANNLVLQATTDITSSSVSAGGNLSVTTSGGNISIPGSVNSNVGQDSGNILLMATGNIGTGSISTNGGANGGTVEIEANTTGGNTLFNIGGGTANGVNGSIDTRVTTAGGSDTDSTTFGVYVANGNSSSTGGITVQSMSNILATASASKSGLVVLNAQMGTLTLPAGTLSVDGQSNNMAGSIALIANTVTTVNGTVLSSTQSPSATGSSHAVVIGANTISVAGANGLQILANGNGVSSADLSSDWLGPLGSVSVTSNENFEDLIIDISITEMSNPMTVSGTGSFTLNANGTLNQVEVIAKPIVFSNTGTTTITANGASSDMISFDNPIINGNPGLSFAGGNVVISTNGVPNVGDGAGGQIQIKTVDVLETPAGTVTLSANGSGSANAGEIDLFDLLGNIPVGNAAGTFNLSATGGPSGGNGGLIQLDSIFGGNVILDTSANNTSIALSALGGTGLGGTLDVTAGSLVNNATGITLSANGMGTAGGGTFNIQVQNPVSIITPAAPAAPSLTLNAQGGSSGAGGNVTINLVNGGTPTHDFDLSRAINVNPGNSAPANTFGGQVSLNGVPCQQISSGQPFPAWYWNCVNPASPQPLDAVPVTVASNLTNLSALLSGQNTQIWVFASAAQFNQFRTESDPAASGGDTFNFLNYGPTTQFLYVNVFESGNLGDNAVHAYTNQQLTEVAAHELGHATDISFAAVVGGGFPSQLMPYRNYVLQDLQNLDWILDTTATPNVFVRRLPCAATPLHTGTSSDTPPFAGVTNIFTGNQVCVGGVLNPADFNPVNFPAMTPNPSNSWVLQQLVAGFLGVPAAQQWSELNAQSFAFQDVGAQGSAPIIDSVYSNAAPSLLGGHYFGCVKAWAAAEIASLKWSSYSTGCLQHFPLHTLSTLGRRRVECIMVW
jgi:hypothetical protein